MIRIEVNEGKVEMSMNGSAAQLAAEVGVMIMLLLNQTSDDKIFNETIMHVILEAIKLHVDAQEGESDNE